MKLDLPEKRYYTIGELAKALNVNTSTLRFWEQHFDTIRPKKNAKGNRMYTKRDIEHIELIHHLLKDRGFTIEGAKDFMKTQPKDDLDNFEIIKKLEHIKLTLLKIKNEI